METIKDYNGKYYDSMADMCKVYNISVPILKQRLSRGYTLYNALNKSRRAKKVAYDMYGNKFRNLDEMCEAYNISRSAYSNRAANNWTLINTLTQNIKRLARFEYVYDIYGNKHMSIVDMCKFYNVSIVTYFELMNSGKSEASIFTCIQNNNVVAIDLSDNHATITTDHLGNKYESIEEMCSDYNINPITFKIRIKAGYSLERALTEPAGSIITLKSTISKNAILLQDHLGNKYLNAKELCNVYDISVKIFRERIVEGWDLGDALTISYNKSKQKHS